MPLIKQLREIALDRPEVEITHRDGRIQTGTLDEVTAINGSISLFLVDQKLQRGKRLTRLDDGSVTFMTNKVECLTASGTPDRGQLVITMDDEHGYTIRISTIRSARSA